MQKPETVASAATPAAAPAVVKPTFERRQQVTVSGDTTTTVRESLRDGQVVWRAEEIVSVRDNLRTYITREFRLIDGVLTLVKEQTIVYPAVVDVNQGKDQHEDE